MSSEAKTVPVSRDEGTDNVNMPARRADFIRRRLAAANAYPLELVVLLGERVVFHSPDRAEAVARYRAVSTEAGESELPALVEPGKRRLRPDPVVRGRSTCTATK